jgi:hypothetical protein
LEPPVVVAVIVVGVVQVVGDQVVDMVAVRHRLMAASGAMGMPGLMLAAGMLRGAVLGVRLTGFDHVLVHVIPVRVMQVPVVQVVHMSVVAHGGVATVRTVLV